jgi:hypothetical protein
MNTNSTSKRLKNAQNAIQETAMPPPPPPPKRRRPATPPPAEHETQVKATILQIWAWEESHNRKPDIETIFDFLNIDQIQRYELLKSEFVRTMSSRPGDQHEVIDVEAQTRPRDRTSYAYSQDINRIASTNPFQIANPGNGGPSQEACQEWKLEIKVIDTLDLAEVYFRLLRTTQMNKVFDAFCHRQGIPQHQLRFIFDGGRVGDLDTPETLEMVHGDIIEAHYEQVV